MAETKTCWKLPNGTEPPRQPYPITVSSSLDGTTIYRRVLVVPTSTTKTETKSTKTETKSTKTYRDASFHPSDLHRTELCLSVISGRSCQQPSFCRFAHSIDEIQPRRWKSNYRRRICQSFLTTGSCQATYRCHFIHDDVQLTDCPASITVSIADGCGRLQLRRSTDGSATATTTTATTATATTVDQKTADGYQFILTVPLCALDWLLPGSRSLFQKQFGTDLPPFADGQIPIGVYRGSVDFSLINSVPTIPSIVVKTVATPSVSSMPVKTVTTPSSEYVQSKTTELPVPIVTARFCISCGGPLVVVLNKSTKQFMSVCQRATCPFGFAHPAAMALAADYIQFLSVPSIPVKPAAVIQPPKMVITAPTDPTTFFDRPVDLPIRTAAEPRMITVRLA